MRKIFASLAAVGSLLVLAACSGGSDNPASPQSQDDDLAGTRPADQPSTLALEGRLEQGTECLVLHTPDGERWAISDAGDFGPGDYVEIRGERADASFCMAGEGTLIPQRIGALQPPAADRDPARAGGVALTESYVTGSWAAPGLNADCDRPDFQITSSPSETLVIETSVNGTPETGRVVLGDYPRIDWDDPLPDMPIESRGPDGLAILRPATDAEYEAVDVAGNPVAGDGVEFIKCG